MLLNAAGTEVNRWNQRGIGVAVVTFALVVHGVLRAYFVLLRDIPDTYTGILQQNGVFDCKTS
jgi:hypothetical protein